MLRKFDISDGQLPLELLKKELVKRPRIVYDIHSKKFEELVGSVFSDFYETTVRLIGRRGDKGIDLIYLDGPNPIALQVKRRQDPHKVEQVALVREFLGAMLTEGFNHGTIVTTAQRFSKGSYETRDKAVGKGVVQR